MKLIVGLGNPGERYSKTRHNLGFMVVDEFAKKHLGPEITWDINKKFNAEMLDLGNSGQVTGNSLILMKPLTFMNNSGQAVYKVASFYKVKPEDIIVIHDELDLPMGKIKVRRGGSAAGHHGVESIMNDLKTDQFVRVRLGIGNVRSRRGERGLEHFSADIYVTEAFMPSEKNKTKQMLKKAVGALDLLLAEGLEKAQNQFN